MDDLERFISVRTLGRRWNAVRAGWPALLIPLLGSLVVTSTGQGREALYAATRPDISAITSLVLLACGIILHARFLAAVNRHYPFSADAIYPSVPVPRVALFAALTMPLAFGLFYLWHALASRAPGAEEAWHPVYGLLACLATIAGLSLFHFVAARRLVHVFQTHQSRFLVLDRHLRRSELVLLVAFFVAAIVIWKVPPLASAIGPVSVFAVGMTVWAVVGTLIVSFVAQRDWLPAPLLAGIAIVAGVALLIPLLRRNYYAVATVEGSARPEKASRFAADWLAEHGGRGHAPVTAIVVTADGGGIRAALETAYILAELDALTKGRFYDNVYALSGVSGGAIGLAIYVAAHAEHIRDRDMPDRVTHALAADHFSPLLAGLLLRDIPDMILPLSVLHWSFLENRAQLFERSLAEESPAMAWPLEAALARSARGRVPPALLLNTTLANAGSVETVSNVSFPTKEVADPLCNVLDRLSQGRTLSLAAAAHLSARFPITNPPGEIDQAPDGGSGPCAVDRKTRLAYVDGGYADNTGALAARYAVEALANARPSGTVLRIVVIHVYATDIDPLDKEEIRRAGEATESLEDIDVPMQAVSSVRYEQGLDPLKELCARVARADGDPADQPLCWRIGSLETMHRPGNRAVVGRLWGPDAHPPSCLLWLNAALYVSDVYDDPHYIPLGWMLGPSQRDLLAQSKHVAQEIAEFLTAKGAPLDTDPAVRPCHPTPAL